MNIISGVEGALTKQETFSAVFNVMSDTIPTNQRLIFIQPWPADAPRLACALMKLKKVLPSGGWVLNLFNTLSVVQDYIKAFFRQTNEILLMK